MPRSKSNIRVEFNLDPEIHAKLTEIARESEALPLATFIRRHLTRFVRGVEGGVEAKAQQPKKENTP